MNEMCSKCAKIVTHLYSICKFFLWQGLTFSLWIFEKVHHWNGLITKWHFIHSNFILLFACYFSYFSIEILKPSFNILLEVMHQKMRCVLQGALKLPCVHYRLPKSSNKKVYYSFLICLLPLPCIPLKNVFFLIKL